MQTKCPLLQSPTQHLVLWRGRGCESSRQHQRQDDEQHQGLLTQRQKGHAPSGRDRHEGLRLEAPLPAAPVANATLVLWRAEDVKPVANISDKIDEQRTKG